MKIFLFSPFLSAGSDEGREGRDVMDEGLRGLAPHAPGDSHGVEEPRGRKISIKTRWDQPSASG